MPNPSRRTPLARYEIRIFHNSKLKIQNSKLRIVRFEQFAQGGTKNRVKKRTFLNIFAKKCKFLQIFTNFCNFLPIFVLPILTTCAFGAKI